MKTANTLSTTARSAIAHAYVQGLNASENTGSLLHTVCEVARRYTKGEALADDDIKAISADVSRAKGWKAKTAQSRESEVRVILRAVSTLPDAMEAFREKTKGCTWHDGMALARLINKGESINAAVKRVSNKAPGNTGTPEGRTAGALKAWFKVATPKKKEAILAAAGTLGIKLGVKLDA